MELLGCTERIILRESARRCTELSERARYNAGRMKLGIISSFPPTFTGVGQYGWHVTRGLAATGCFGSITVLADHGPADEAPPLARLR